jgi:GNAT superfamily N-acetyltransferase
VRWSVGDYEIDTARERLNIDVVWRYLAEESYWSVAIPRPVLERAIQGSLCYGVYRGSEQVGFARLVTDYATYAYLMDVFVLAAHRERGLAKALLGCITSHPELQGLRRWQLHTRDAHGLYAQFGFTPPADPARLMEKADLEAYTRLYRKEGDS